MTAANVQERAQVRSWFTQVQHVTKGGEWVTLAYLDQGYYPTGGLAGRDTIIARYLAQRGKKRLFLASPLLGIEQSYGSVNRFRR